MNSSSYEIGDLVWAKMKGFPPWPGQIIAPPPGSKVKASYYYVLFYGSNDYGWMSDNKIETHSNILVMKYAKKQKRSATYLNAVEEIVNCSKNIKKKNNKRKSLKLKKGKIPSKKSLKITHNQEKIDEDIISEQNISTEKIPHKKEKVAPVKRTSVATSKILPVKEIKAEKPNSPRKKVVKNKSPKNNSLKNSAIPSTPVKRTSLATSKNLPVKKIKAEKPNSPTNKVMKNKSPKKNSLKNGAIQSTPVKRTSLATSKNLPVKKIKAEKPNSPRKKVVKNKSPKKNSLKKDAIQSKILPSTKKSARPVTKRKASLKGKKKLVKNIKNDTSKDSIFIEKAIKKEFPLDEENLIVKNEPLVTEKSSTNDKLLILKQDTELNGVENQEIKIFTNQGQNIFGVEEIPKVANKRKYLAENIREIIPFKKQNTTKLDFTDIKIPGDILAENCSVVNSEGHLERKLSLEERNTAEENECQVTAISRSVLAESKTVLTKDVLIDKKICVNKDSQNMAVTLHGTKADENIAVGGKKDLDKVATCYAEEQSNSLFTNSLVSETNNFVGMNNQTHFIDYPERGKTDVEENGLIEKNILFGEENCFKIPAPLRSNKISVQKQEIPSDTALQTKSFHSRVVSKGGMSCVRRRISNKERNKRLSYPSDKLPIQNTVDAVENTSIVEINTANRHLENISASTGVKLHTPEIAASSLRRKIINEKIILRNSLQRALKKGRQLNKTILKQNTLMNGDKVPTLGRASSKGNSELKKTILKQNALMNGNKVTVNVPTSDRAFSKRNHVSNKTVLKQSTLKAENKEVPTLDNLPVKEITSLEKKPSKTELPKTSIKKEFMRHLDLIEVKTGLHSGGMKKYRIKTGAKKGIVKKVKRKKIVQDEIIKYRLHASNDDAHSTIFSKKPKLIDDDYSELARFIPPNYTRYSEAIINFNNEVKSDSNSGETPCFSKDPPLKIGFLGLGNLGQRLVRYLLDTGHSLVLWNRTSSKCDLFQGIQVLDNPESVVISCDIIISCLSDAEASKEVVFGNHGVLEGFNMSLIESPTREVKKGYVELTCLDPETSKTISNAITSKGGRYLEAQLNSVRNDGKEGFLYILTAGDTSLYDDCKSCFSAIGKHSLYLGDDVGVASKFNIVQYTFLGILYAAMSECLSLIERIGLRGCDFLKILSEGVFNSSNLVDMGHMIAKHHTSKIYNQNLKKNINLALALGNSVNLPLPITEAAKKVFKTSKLINCE